MKEVNSQSTDSCNSNLLLKTQLPFEPTSFHCLPVWDTHGFILRYMQTDTNVWSFVLSAPNQNGYVGMGFSANGKMVGSSAVVGWVGSDGTPRMKKYFLGGQSPGEVQPDEGSLQLVSLNSSIVAENSRIYIAFQITTDLPSNRLIYSVGPAGQLPSSSTFRLTQHQDQISTLLDYTTGQSETKTLYATLRRTHGLLNLFGWGILVPIGMIVARYFRQWDPVWFYSHTVVQTIAFILGFAGVICGLVLENRLGTDVDTHKGLGIFILALGCLQVIALLVRPNKEAKVRKYWNWYHHNVGRILVIIAIANIFYGIHLGDAGTAWNAGFAIALVVMFFIAAILELRMWTGKD
nr:cytochrome B561 and DOMON domain-containing protein At3g07570-like [Ipomoea batatas]